jgi:N-acetyl-beta-hexosaminidase
MKLLTDWAEQFSQLFPSPFVNIGFDETWEIQKAAEQRGGGATATQLFIGQLNNVSRLFERRGKRVMAWADIMVKYPGIVSQLPPKLIAVPWWYEPSPDPEYKHWLGPLVEKGVRSQ